MKIVKLTDKGEKNLPKIFLRDSVVRMDDFLEEGEKILKKNGNHSEELVVGVEDLEFYTIRQKKELIILTKYWSRSEQGYREKQFQIEFPETNELELGRDILLEEKSYVSGEDLFDEYQFILKEENMWRNIQ